MKLINFRFILDLLINGLINKSVNELMKFNIMKFDLLFDFKVK